MRTNSPRPVMATILLLLCLALPAFAQFDTGRIVGTAKDASGAVLAKAQVKVTNLGTGRVYEATTNDQGDYVVPALPVGKYKVEVTQAGFKTSSVTDIILHTGEAARADVSLPVAGGAEAVNVTADANPVNTTTSELGTVIDSRTVTDLPLNGRDFTSLITLVPGAVTTAQTNSLGGFETQFAGVNVLLDGADATRIDTNATSTDLGRQQSRISRASLDSIAEFRVLSSTYSAEYGRSMGDVVNVITKSGTNNYHGNIFEFFRNDALDARNYFATTDIPLRLNQFGGNLGGPIVKDKLFFFVNYEGVRQVVTTPATSSVLTDAARAGAVASMLPVINAIPHANGPAVPGAPQLAEFIGTLRTDLREDTGSVKVDWNAGNKDTLSFRYNIVDSFTGTQYNSADGSVSPSYSRNHLFKATWNHTFSPTLLNEVGFAFNRPNTDSLGGGNGFPIFQCSAFWGCGGANDFGLAPGPALFSIRRPQHSFEFLDTLTKITGRHTLKFGADIRKVRSGSGLDPQFFLAYDNFNDFLGNFNIQLSTLGWNLSYLGNTNLDFFAQDDIKVTRRFTVNLGLRYEYNTVLSGPQIANFDVNTLTVGTPGAPLYRPDRNNFAPRIGFAWDIFGSGKTVLRSGFGIFYSPQLTGAALSLAQNLQPTVNVNLFDLFAGTTCNGNPLAYPVPANISCTPTPPQSVNALDPNMRDTYSMHWSFGVQQQLVKNTVLEVAYVGNRGMKLPAGASSAGLELNLSPVPFAPNQLSPNFANIRLLGDFLSSTYNSLQVSVRRHMAKGLTLDANYTWAHEFDDAVNIFNAFQDSHNPQGDWSVGDIDVRNNFTLGLVYDIPIASSLPPRLGKGWQVSSIFQARGGLPYNIANAAPFLGTDQYRPSFVPGVNPIPANYNVPNNQFDPAAFSPDPNNPGNVPRNFGRGPGFNQLDLGISKTTMLTERYNLQFRLDTFNLFNHPNFANPSGILNDLQNRGKSTSTIGNSVGTGTSRQMQLALKFIF